MNDSSLAPILRFVLAERGCPPTPGLEAMATWLPAVACAGMELPLTGDGPADLQQRVRTAPEVDRLTRYLKHRAGNSGLSLDFSWQRVLQICRTELLNGRIEDLWLELDDIGREGTPPLSVFIRLPALPRQTLWPAIERILTACDAAPSAARQDALVRCLDACSPKVHVSHLGLMLGRPGAPIRLIVDEVGYDDIAAFLTRAGFPGDAQAAQQRADTLFTSVDRIRLALTIGDFLLPMLGFECFLGRPEENDPRWQCALDQLVREGLCSREARDRILAWPAILTPDAVAGDWPHSLVMEALARSPKEIGWLECRISHVKVTLAEDRSLAAKAYIGFVESWADVTADEPATRATPEPRLSAREPAQALAAAEDFLLAARTQAGWWLDYDGFQEGVSDEWVTAYVAHAMHECGDDRAASAARRAWDLLTQRGRAGWGWNSLQPADADSTLWALQLAARLGTLDSEAARDALTFLRLHVLDDGGVATYRPDRKDGRPAGTDINPEWYTAHACVTAAAASFEPLGPGPLEFLRRMQQADGCWTGYWWKSSIYTTVHAAEAFVVRGRVEDSVRVTRAAQWAESSLNASPAAMDPGASPFATALALRLLLLAPTTPRELIAAIMRQLLASQYADGSWSASALLAIPNARGQEVPAIDNRRIFTTATVLRLLCRLRSVPVGW